MPYKDKEKRREYARVYRAKRRSDFFSNKVCSLCNNTHNLELHHINPNIKISSNVWTWSEIHRNKEIEKCIVLCKKCHRDYHNILKTNLEHGTASLYNKGCRCLLCKEYKSNKWKLYVLNKNALVAQLEDIK